MSSDQDLRRWLRRWLLPLQRTPVHPQWLVKRRGGRRLSWVSQLASGYVLDIGCAGGGVFSVLDKVDGYCGLDYPATASGLYGTRPDIFADAACLPLADASFDTVLMLDVLEHVREPEAALAEASRVLRSGGRLLLIIPFAYPMHDQPHDYQRITEHGLVHRLHKAGLVVNQLCEAGGAGEAAASNFAIALSQGGIDAIQARSWRILLLPLLPLCVVAANLAGWLSSRLFPTEHLAPGSYYVEAIRP
jgi:SAM-dependent methyltransferase